MRNRYKIMLVAGEASGDEHGSRLVRALRAAGGDRFEFFGSAGPAMRSLGVDAIVRADDLAIIGVPEIARSLGKFLRAFRKLKKAAVDRKPDAVVLIDFPEFNLRLAKSLKRNEIRVIYYISPQLWAWRKYRRRTIRNSVDLLMAVLPFEKEWYASRGIQNVEFVGHPLTNEVIPERSREEFRRQNSISDEAPLIALLPGSRHKELSRILPPMLESAAILSARDRSLRFIIALASTRNEDEVRAVVRDLEARGIDVPKSLIVVKGETYDALNAADAAAVASGTATLETGMIGTPMAIVYRSSNLNYRLLRPLINVPHFGLINLIAGKRLVAEFIQGEFTPTVLAAELGRLLDPPINAEMRRHLKEAVAKLGEGGASKRAAEAIIRLIKG